MFSFWKKKTYQKHTKNIPKTYQKPWSNYQRKTQVDSQGQNESQFSKRQAMTQFTDPDDRDLVRACAISRRGMNIQWSRVRNILRADFPFLNQIEKLKRHYSFVTANHSDLFQEVTQQVIQERQHAQRALGQAPHEEEDDVMEDAEATAGAVEDWKMPRLWKSMRQISTLNSTNASRACGSSWRRR